MPNGQQYFAIFGLPQKQNLLRHSRSASSSGHDRQRPYSRPAQRPSSNLLTFQKYNTVKTEPAYPMSTETYGGMDSLPLMMNDHSISQDEDVLYQFHLLNMINQNSVETIGF